MSLCRLLLDGILDSSTTTTDTAHTHMSTTTHQQHQQQQQQQQIISGRCVICKRSTFESDLQEGESVILCDGCNAEAHFACTKVTSVSMRIHMREYVIIYVYILLFYVGLRLHISALRVYHICLLYKFYTFILYLYPYCCPYYCNN